MFMNVTLACCPCEADFAIVHRSTSTQFLKLIIEPLRSGTSSSQSAPFLVVVDGLHECGGKDHQLQILSHISDLTTKYHLPVRFLIASHPESHTKYFFGVPIGLLGDKFLRSKFDEISASERHTALAHIDKPWPSDDIVRCSAWESDGYFIYASTLLKDIDDEFLPCTKRLRGVLQAASSISTVLVELDKLCTQIPSTCPNTKLLFRVLGCLIFLPTYGLIQSLRTVELELWPSGGTTILQGLHAEPETAKPVHAPLSDFLFDGSRSNEFYIDPQIGHRHHASHSSIGTHWEPKKATQSKHLLYLCQPSLLNSELSNYPQSAAHLLDVEGLGLQLWIQAYFGRSHGINHDDRVHCP